MTVEAEVEIEVKFDSGRFLTLRMVDDSCPWRWTPTLPDMRTCLPTLPASKVKQTFRSAKVCKLSLSERYIVCVKFHEALKRAL